MYNLDKWAAILATGVVTFVCPTYYAIHMYNIMLGKATVCCLIVLYQINLTPTLHAVRMGKMHSCQHSPLFVFQLLCQPTG